MPSGPGGADANGVRLYGESDSESLFSDLLNLGLSSVSAQITLDRARLTALETRAPAEMHQIITLVPASNLDTPTTAGVSTAWITLASVTVPTWASSVLIDWTLNGIAPTATGNNVSVQIALGGVLGALERLWDIGTTNRYGYSRRDKLTGLSTGAQDLIVRATKVSGSGVYRADTNSQISARLTFLP